MLLLIMMMMMLLLLLLMMMMLLMLLMQMSYFTGDEPEDNEVLEMVQQLLDVLKCVPFIIFTIHSQLSLVTHSYS